MTPFVSDATRRCPCRSHSYLFSLTVFPRLQRNGHRHDAANHADPGVITAELLDILNGITQMEEMLCSVASPCFVMWVCKGGQYITRGKVLTFSQDAGPLCSTLPCLPKDLKC
jgi:hypothetical protein